jgi:hypothetical protein
MAPACAGYPIGMTKPTPPPVFREPDPARRDRPDEDPDFAAEHDDATFADEMPGGPEQARDPDSPEGQSGMDG